LQTAIADPQKRFAARAVAVKLLGKKFEEEHLGKEVS
jgi:hypothetical protein